ncbi:MAG: hypothetical protein C4520_07820 [Candidatus Abyssobacteria bacterium SURF_5]|uniref:Secretin/TonB short N-terminal domain-containing protein n=1 Tax=Abyssobacteria bacterium (strain SURF_5) TaxID=2093360 RepID=A0A3A4NXD0_ABYX5|nr:MAG: hypothetical protein C4520_07820 [Candidatus Abyssubacteria bacterium SURF_5]
MRRSLLVLMAITLLLPGFATRAAAFEVERSALFCFLHEAKPLEEEAMKALEEKDYALALRKYREALNAYERIWQEYPNLPEERPHGLDRMVDESIATCKTVIEEIEEQGEAQDEFYQKLNQLIRVDFEGKDIQSVAKSLTFLTDVNIIVDDTVFRDDNKVLDPKISLRVDEDTSLRKIIVRICDQTGLAYSIETDHVFISTRVKLDRQK